MSRRRILLILGLGLCAAAGCGDDASPVADARVADAAVDAGIPDAGAPDAFDPCPGKATFQVGVVDWASNANLLGVVVTEGATANQATSAPNGRVVLCIAKTGPVELHFSHASYLDRVHTTTGEIAAEQYAAGSAPTFRMLSASQEATLYASDGKTPDAGATTAIVMVRTRPSGADASGATVSIGATNEGAYTPGADVDSLVAGSTTGAEGRVLFLNTSSDPASTSAQVTGLASCTLPATMALGAGGISSVSAVCGP
jgi:hypothetical protein